MYERMLASKAGLPLSLTDDDISIELPQDFDMSNPPVGCENYIFPEAEFIRNCVKITQINANILRRLYTRQPSTNILPIVHELVFSLLNWKKSLPDDINCDYQQKDITISRLVVNMMTEYFQGINLAVRPLLFHFVLLNLNSGNPKRGAFLDLSKYSPVILSLLNASFQASINTVRSLWALMPENMVALFGYMDREYLFTASATLILFNSTFGVHEATLEHLDHTLMIFTKMRNLGNHPATLRREQLLKLLSILDFNGAMVNLIKKHSDNQYAPNTDLNIQSDSGVKYSDLHKLMNPSSTNSQSSSQLNSMQSPHHPLSSFTSFLGTNDKPAHPGDQPHHIHPFHGQPQVSSFRSTTNMNSMNTPDGNNRAGDTPTPSSQVLFSPAMGSSGDGKHVGRCSKPGIVCS
ncbi:unnamed protein product [Ambrosiozyma monospora]|uniref:Unnamed protein product n=1 Tax=Ambrosiozyma monospora TaxID=43982 RepID=A0ACB5TB93_AMBMO|nr:unnamed protein product [Ambrosiozyma monospora]